MANDTSSNPFTIDTVTDTAIFTDRFVCHSLVLASAAADDQVAVLDQDGNKKWAGEALNSTNVPHYFNPPLRFNGLKVTTIGGGTLYMYVTIKR